MFYKAARNGGLEVRQSAYVRQKLRRASSRATAGADRASPWASPATRPRRRASSDAAREAEYGLAPCGATGRVTSSACRRAIERPAHASRSCRRSSSRAAERGPSGARRRLRPLVHRHRLHRRGDAAARRHEPRARRRRRRAASSKVEGGHRAPRPQRGALRARAGAREPGRHRRADDRRRDLDRHARHRRALRQHLQPRSRRWSWCPPTARCVECSRDSRPRDAARGARRRSAPRRDRHRDAALRAGVHAPPPRPPAAAGRDARAPRRAGRAQRPLRVLRLSPQRRRALPREPSASTRRRSRAAALQEYLLRRRCSRTARSGSLCAPAGASRRGSRDQPARSRGWPAARVKTDRSYRVFATTRQRALHRDGVRDPARGRAGGAAARARR